MILEIESARLITARENFRVHIKRQVFESPPPPWAVGSRKHDKHVSVGHVSWVVEFLNNSLFISSEDIPQSGTTKALDICVQQKLPGSETHFNLWLLRDQKQKSEEVFLGACEHKSGSGREQVYWKQRSYLSCRNVTGPGSIQSWKRNFIGKFFYSGDFTFPLPPCPLCINFDYWTKHFFRELLLL